MSNSNRSTRLPPTPIGSKPHGGPVIAQALTSQLEKSVEKKTSVQPAASAVSAPETKVFRSFDLEAPAAQKSTTPATPMTPEAIKAPAVREVVAMRRSDTSERLSPRELQETPFSLALVALLRALIEGAYPLRNYINLQLLTAFAMVLGRQLTTADINRLVGKNGVKRTCKKCANLFQPMMALVLNEGKIYNDRRSSPEELADDGADAKKYGDLAPYIRTDEQGNPLCIGSFLTTTTDEGYGAHPFCGAFFFWVKKDDIVVRARGCLSETLDRMREKGYRGSAYPEGVASEIVERELNVKPIRPTKQFVRDPGHNRHRNGGAFGAEQRKHRERNRGD